MLEYIKNVRSEGRKIVFPDKKEVQRNTITTLVVCAVASLILWGVSELVIKLISLVVA